MNCKQCQEHILTDYLDGQAIPRLKQEIDGHLASCSQCKEFLTQVEKMIVEPFKNAPRIMPSEEIWENIRRKISDEKRLENGEWIERFNNVFFPRPVIALALVILLMVMTLKLNALSGKDNFVRNGADLLGNDYMAYLFADDDGSGEYGTSIEQYFL